MESGISQKFHAIQQRLKERSTTIEDLVAVRDFMKPVPDSSRFVHFELLEKYEFELPNNDFRNGIYLLLKLVINRRSPVAASCIE